MSVEETYDRIPPHEFQLWQAFFRLEPFGPAREDLRAGQIAAAAYNTIRKGAPAKASDFFPELDPNASVTGRKKTVEQMYQEARMAVAATHAVAAGRNGQG